MAEIKIAEKIVAPAVNWTQLTVDCSDENLTRCAYKVVFDRTYPYFWVHSRYNSAGVFGVALTYEDLELAAVFDEQTEEFNGFDLTADGVLPLDGRVALCIAMGARQAFYILSNAVPRENGSKYPFLISAQDDPVCPFAVVNPFN